MSQSVRVWSLALAACVAAGDAFAAPGRGPSLSLAWVDVAGTAPWAFSPAASELSTLLGSMGIHASVREVDVHAVTTASELTVILLPQRPARSRLSADAMGATSIGAGSQRTMVVFVAEVARTLGLPPPRPTWSIPQRRELGVALGRVVAHELVHALVPAQPHLREGLMAPTLSRVQLRGPAPTIVPAMAEAMRAALGEPPPR
jgi:hypothetical protein